jgi:hypothetical protein
MQDARERLRFIVTAAEIIREIEALPPQEQEQVVRFAWRLGAWRKLSPAELGTLAERLATTSDSVEAAALREEIMQGFYGVRSNA